MGAMLSWMKMPEHADFSCNSQAEAVKRLEEAAGAAGLDQSVAESCSTGAPRVSGGAGTCWACSLLRRLHQRGHLRARPALLMSA